LKRECIVIARSADGKKAIGIDIQNKDSILNYVNQSPRHLKKWKHIIQLILEGHKNSNLYDKEDISEKCKDVTAMKPFKGRENDRIYCKEQNEDGLFLIVMAELYERKKTSKLSKKEIPIIKKIASYEYTIK
jgi:hypothetical protein